MASDAAREAGRIFARKWPDLNFLTSPSLGGLDYAIRQGATPEAAADQAKYFLDHAICPGGQPYASYGVEASYVAWTLQHNDGADAGFGYGLSPEQFTGKYATLTGAFDPLRPPPGYKRDEKGVYVIAVPGPPATKPPYTCPPGHEMDGNANCIAPLDERFLQMNAIFSAKAGVSVQDLDVLKKLKEIIDAAIAGA